MDGKIQSFVMNLEHPRLEKNEKTGKLWNINLRVGDAPTSDYSGKLGGELFEGFINLFGNKTEIVVLDDWRPKA
jgi:hypothetical protein